MWNVSKPGTMMMIPGTVIVMRGSLRYERVLEATSSTSSAPKNVGGANIMDHLSCRLFAANGVVD
jgi:hypothetical protein